MKLKMSRKSLTSVTRSPSWRELQALGCQLKFSFSIRLLEFREAERCLLVAEDAAIEAMSFGDDPVTLAVLAHDKMEWIGAVRRFLFAERFSKGFGHGSNSFNEKPAISELLAVAGFLDARIPLLCGIKNQSVF
jgi:hypothetical protein